MKLSKTHNKNMSYFNFGYNNKSKRRCSASHGKDVPSGSEAAETKRFPHQRQQ
jgi:hypothetical protein